MSIFFKKLTLFFLLICILICVIISFSLFVVGSQYNYCYQASMIDKVERLKGINEPKIILVGHSNIAFGIQSELIESAFGMPVVNLGLHGGFGNAFHEQIAKINIREGDIVIVCHSTYSDDDIIGDTDLAWITLDNNLELLPIFRVKDYWKMLNSYPTYLRNSTLLWIKKEGNQIPVESYSRTAFNKFGDVEYKPIDGQIIDFESYFEEKKIKMPQINDTCVNRLNEFNDFCNDRGAKLLVAGYPIAYGQYTYFTKTDIEIFQKELEKALNCDVISNFTDYFYPYDFFYDTNLHLNEQGAEVRTKQLISELSNWMKDINVHGN